MKKDGLDVMKTFKIIPVVSFFISEEKELWNELHNLESEMKLKGIK